MVKETGDKMKLPTPTTPPKPITPNNPLPSITRAEIPKSAYELSQEEKERKWDEREERKEHSICAAQAVNLAQNELLAMQTKSDGKWDLAAFEILMPQRTKYYFDLLVQMKKSLK
jgi:hypothetical protein